MSPIEIELVDGLPKIFKFLCDECFNSLHDLHGKEIRKAFRATKVWEMLAEGITEEELLRADKIATLTVKKYMEMEEKARKYDELQKSGDTPT